VRVDERFAIPAATAAIAAYLACLLLADRYADRGEQLLLGVVTLIVLVLAACAFEPAIRCQAALVVVVATGAEVIGSIVWGVYQYRLGNLPAFVPPGHGLVYLCGFGLALSLRGREQVLVRIALAAVVIWGVAGVSVLPRLDLSGLIGCAVLAVVLARTRHPVYAGVFLAVAALELYGTALGTWTWAARVPGLELAQGNPPSGVASGYVLFDVLALALAPLLLRRRLRVQPAPAYSKTRASARSMRTAFRGSW
jgi:hypothetical protein